MIDLLSLQALLERPACSVCNVGRVRPIDILDGQHLTFQCSNRQCRFSRRIKLPMLSRKLIYLDTSTVSHMARAIKRGDDESSPYVRLYAALRDASYRNVVACPGSSIVESEAELSQLADDIIKISRQLGDWGLEHDLHVKESQIFRALDRYLAGEPPTAETDPPLTDTFDQNINRWHGMFSIHSNIRPSAEFLEERRTSKAASAVEIERIYQSYADDSLPYSEIASREAAGYGRGLLLDAQATMKERAARLSGQGESPFVWLPTTYDKISHAISERQKTSHIEAAREAALFLVSEHVRLIPVAVINSRMHAALAILSRGQSPRKLQPGDSYDIDHLATYCPYFDVFIADRFVADLATQRHVNVGDDFHVEIRSLGPKQIDEFIEWLQNLIVNDPIAALSSSIYDSIWAGGYHQEFAAFAKAYVDSFEKRES